MQSRDRRQKQLMQAIVDTAREPLLVLDQDLRVVGASRSFYRTFDVSSEATLGRLVYELGEGEWNIPALRHLLERIVPEHSVMEDFEVEYVFPRMGHRILLSPRGRYSTRETRTPRSRCPSMMSPRGGHLSGR